MTNLLSVFSIQFNEFAYVHGEFLKKLTIMYNFQGELAFKYAKLASFADLTTRGSRPYHVDHDHVQNCHVYPMSFRDPRTIDWPLCGSPFPILSIIFSYVYFVKVLGPQWMKNREPFKIERIIVLYNILMVIFSAGFFIYGGSYSYIPPWGKFSWICEPINYTTDPEVIDMITIGWWFLLLKIVEFADTIFFVLRKKFTHISALHVIHHSLVAWGIWIGMKFGAEDAFNTLTPKPAVTAHATSILVGRISTGCCSESREKAVGRVVIKGTLRGEVGDERPAFISPTTRSEEKRGNGVDESIPQIN
ncbi:Elongation of very long chain fatty acids protein AAEL008004 [Araneus ventricosus]|uniref:Elongation of very long chain fatty acids protein n=1 Tax=Araneus ventricosus TaxID=182803 RepID=A0A4Y2CRM8_ARAVE|nr:Elongation of very long chain fatty acids protein AAEL008004 [Araneus ventricosus]